MAAERRGLRALAIVPPLAIGAAVLAWQLAGREAPEQAAPGEIARPVRVITVTPGDFVPRALGYGHVVPGSVWEAVAEVAGKIIYRNPDLDRGRLLPAETVLLRIDPADYELAIARIEASLEAARAETSELTVSDANTRSSLEIARRTLGLAEQDLARKKALLTKGNASQASVDQAESATLAERQRVQDLENQLNLIPVQRRVLEANLVLNEAQLEEARLDLQRTEIRLPFEARIAEVAVEEAQFVGVGQRLAVADSIAVAEVTAQMALDRLRPLVREGLDIASLTAEELAKLPERLGFEAQVRLLAGELEATWAARLDRISDTIDPQTRTFGLVVAVDEPYRKAIPGKRPPLTKNMFVEVELRTPARPEHLVVPRVAVHEDRDGRATVYLAGPDDRLAFRPVTLGPAQGDFVVIAEGLAGGERVVVSDLIPAIGGMLLVPNDDARLAERLAAEAAGRGPLR